MSRLQGSASGIREYFKHTVANRLTFGILWGRRVATKNRTLITIFFLFDVLTENRVEVDTATGHRQMHCCSLQMLFPVQDSAFLATA